MDANPPKSGVTPTVFQRIPQSGPCEHDFDNPVRKGRAHYVCRKCLKDITFELVLIMEANLEDSH